MRMKILYIHYFCIKLIIFPESSFGKKNEKSHLAKINQRITATLFLSSALDQVFLTFPIFFNTSP